VTQRPAIDLFVAECPSRGLLEIIGNKWSLLIISALGGGAMRTGDLQRRVGEISPKMLAQTLKTLEAHGLVTRRDYGEVPPRVDYRLTDLGQSLRNAVAFLDNWVILNFWTVADRCAANAHPIGQTKAGPTTVE
jgi:DNA-binding HxlR family transcriptional regulator